METSAWKSSGMTTKARKAEKAHVETQKREWDRSGGTLASDGRTGVPEKEDAIMAREECAVRCDAEEAAFNRDLRCKHIAQALEALYGSVRAQETAPSTPEFEALQQALMGFPGALAACAVLVA